MNLNRDFSDKSIPHIVRKGDLTELIVDGKPFIILGGEVHNSSASNINYMEPIWDRMVELNCNTVIAPVYWELIEPAEGCFDFSLVKYMIMKAREHGLKLVLLWFGTWKNSSSTYAPAWVKTNVERFTRVKFREEKIIPDTFLTYEPISCFCEEACKADARAFSNLMKYLKQIDGDAHTVITVQVENELGLLGVARDYCSEAETLFYSEIPAELREYLINNGDNMVEEIRQSWISCGKKENGNWEDVFGDVAEEAFTSWYMAKYVDAVAAAGKKEYALPMYVNAWIVQYPGQKPGQYPSGGPVSRMLDIWKCSAHNIDFISPDIYLENFEEICASYTRNGNPLFIPEARRDKSTCANLFYAVGHCDALCFSPFGIDSIGLEEGPEIVGVVPEQILEINKESAANLLSKSYSLLNAMMPVIVKYRGTGQMIGVIKGTENVKTLQLGDYILNITYSLSDAPGGGIIIAVTPNEYIIAGFNLKVDFRAIVNKPRRIDYLYIEEGKYMGGKWIEGRRLNGDEYGVYLGTEPGIIKTALYTY